MSREGEPPGHAVRTLSIGMRLAEQIGLDDEARSALFHALLLKDAGCSSNASRLSSLSGADDHTAKAAMKRIDSPGGRVPGRGSRARGRARGRGPLAGGPGL